MVVGIGVTVVDSVMLGLWVQVTVSVLVIRNGEVGTICWKTLGALKTSPSAALTADMVEASKLAKAKAVYLNCIVCEGK